MNPLFAALNLFDSNKSCDGIPPKLTENLVMPAKNNPNHAKTSLFPRFKANSTS